LGVLFPTLTAILEAFDQARSHCVKPKVSLTNSLIIEKPYVFSQGLGSKIYVFIVDLEQIQMGTSYYSNE